jgi:hypothetical protein
MWPFARKRKQQRKHARDERDPNASARDPSRDDGGLLAGVLAGSVLFSSDSANAREAQGAPDSSSTDGGGSGFDTGGDFGGDGDGFSTGGDF